jgi:hypothetical protein
MVSQPGTWSGRFGKSQECLVVLPKGKREQHQGLLVFFTTAVIKNVRRHPRQNTFVVLAQKSDPN